LPEDAEVTEEEVRKTEKGIEGWASWVPSSDEIESKDQDDKKDDAINIEE
jgi:hypothetical protein